MPDPQNERPKSPPEGDERTPDKTQGQIKYAPGQGKKSEGGAGEPSVSEKNTSLQDDRDPSDIGQRTAKAEHSQKEGPAAYAPHEEDKKTGTRPTEKDGTGHGDGRRT